MIKFAPILLALVYGLVSYRFSAWRLAKTLDEQSTELADPILKGFCDQLAGALELPRIKVHIYETEPINGLAAPDGRIFITRGLYNKFLAGDVSAEEITSVIAHELGHMALGHSRKRMISFSGQNALRTAFAMVLSRFIPFVGGWIADGLTTLMMARLSRKDEFEADAYAAALLHKAGIGVAPQKTLFANLESLNKGNTGAKPAWLLHHPKTHDRIAAIEKLERKWGVPGEAE
ncbi:MAG: M48 family metallopeptidase [Aliishimia sp.]